MFFNAKKLIAQKEQLNDKIQAEHHSMDIAYLNLKNAIRGFYCGYQHFDIFDITTIDFWFGDIACYYEGSNYDLSDALHKLCDDLEGVEAEYLSVQQFLSIYNIFSILFNDMYAGEEPIIVNSNLTHKMLLDKFKALSEKLISCLIGDPNESEDRMCAAVEKFYTLLDFSLNDTPEHRRLRQLKSRYLAAQKSGYRNIDYYEKEIEKIDKQLEKHGYSEIGEKVSRKEIEPFPTLKAYNNAMHLLGCCVTAVEKYEKEGDILTPSCVDDITDILLDRFALAKDEFDEWDNSIDYEKIAHTMLAQATFDMLASGRYHLYAGILNPLNCSAKLMLVYNKAMEYGVKIGMVTPKEKREQYEYLLKCISEVG